MEDENVKRIASDIVTGLCVKRGQMIGFKENEWLEDAITKALLARRPSSPSRERVEVLEARKLAIEECEQIAGQVGRQFCSGDGYVMGGPAAIVATICGAIRALKAPSDG